MILAAVSDGFLRDVAAHAAHREEDLLFRDGEMLAALRFGFPRLLLLAEDEVTPVAKSARILRPTLPSVVLARSRVREWDQAWRKSGVGWSRAEDAGRRLSGLIHVTASTPPWTLDVFGHLSRATGGPLPPAFRSFARRILEFPRRYPDLHAVAALTGSSRDAVKARFRRRGLPSPSLYLRWLRTVAVAYALGEDGATTANVAYRFGYSSGGNLCRSVTGLVGLTTLELREPISRSRLLLRFAAELLDEDKRRAWGRLDDLFVRRAA